MALTKDDLQAIGELVSGIIKKQVRPMVKEEVGSAIENQVRPMFAEQNKFMERGFTDLKESMKDTYVSRDEFEEKYNGLQNEVDDLRTELHELKQRFA